MAVPDDERRSESQPHNRRATDRIIDMTERRDGATSNSLAVLQLIATVCVLVGGAAAYMAATNSTQTRVNTDLPAQIEAFKKDMADKFSASQATNNAQFAALAAAIANVPALTASVPQLTERVGRIEQQLDTVRSTSIQTQADLKAALQAGIASQHGGPR